MLLALWSCASKLVRLCASLTLFGTIGPVAALAQIPIYQSLPQTLRVAVSVYAEQSVNYVVVAAFLLLAPGVLRCCLPIRLLNFTLQRTRRRRGQ